MTVIKTQRLIDKYPVTYKELFVKVRKAKPGVKQNQLNKFIKDHNLKFNPKYAIFNFISKIQEEK